MPRRTTKPTSDSGGYEPEGAVAAHEAAGDPHPTYATDAEVAAAVSSHEEAADPHPGYLTQTEADGLYSALGHSHAPSDPWTYVSLGTDFSTSGTANANVTGLAFTPAANKLYAVEGRLLLRSAAATTGPRPGIAWPTGLDDGASQITAPNSNTALAFRAQGAKTTQNAASTGVPTTTDSYLAILDAVVDTGASPSGNFQITLASEIAASLVTMRAGSFIRYREL